MFGLWSCMGTTDTYQKSEKGDYFWVFRKLCKSLKEIQKDLRKPFQFIVFIMDNQPSGYIQGSGPEAILCRRSIFNIYPQFQIASSILYFSSWLNFQHPIKTSGINSHWTLVLIIGTYSPALWSCPNLLREVNFAYLSQARILSLGQKIFVTTRNLISRRKMALIQ